MTSLFQRSFFGEVIEISDRGHVPRWKSSIEDARSIKSIKHLARSISRDRN